VLVKRSGKKSEGSPSAPPAAAAETEIRTGKRRSARHSGEHENADPPALPVKKRRKDRSSSEVKQDQGGERYPKNPQQPEKDQEGERYPKNPQPEQDPQRNHSHSYETTFDATKIALPFADTPVIRRNKEMRKTNNARRSSLGLRGRRASSLIDTGKSNGKRSLPSEAYAMADIDEALPHDEVESAEFYKHIESEGLSEPRRMKQLLTWCGTRALGEKPSFSSEDSGARLAGTTQWAMRFLEHWLTAWDSTRDTVTAAEGFLNEVRHVRLVWQGKQYRIQGHQSKMLKLL